MIFWNVMKYYLKKKTLCLRKKNRFVVMQPLCFAHYQELDKNTDITLMSAAKFKNVSTSPSV